MKLTAKEYLLLGVIVSVAIALRVYGLGFGGLWYDEVFSAEIARMASIDLVIRTANDVHPPLYYLLLRGWNLLTGSEVDGVMRGLSAVLDVLAMGATAFLAWVVFKQRSAVWMTLGIHALSPFAILYAQELRMYSLLLLCSAFSIAGMYLLAEKPTRRSTALYLVATFAALYTHIFAVFLVFAQSVWFLTRPQGTGLSRARWFGLQVAVAIGYSPWAWVITRQMLWAKGHQAKSNWWIPVPQFKSLVGVIFVLLGNDWALLGLGGVLLLAAGWVVFRRPKADALQAPTRAFSLIVAIPIVVAFVVSHITTPVFVARFFTEVLPALWMLLLVGLFALPANRARYGVFALFLLLSARAIPASNYSHSFKTPTPYREVISALRGLPEGRVAIDSTDATGWVWRWYVGLDPTMPASMKTPLRIDTPEALATLAQDDRPAYVVWAVDHAAPPSFKLASGVQLVPEPTNFDKVVLYHYVERPEPKQ